MNESLEQAAEELLECLQKFIYVLKGREFMVDYPERSVYGILREIKQLAGTNPNEKIQNLCDEAALIIEKNIIGSRRCEDLPRPLK